MTEAKDRARMTVLKVLVCQACIPKGWTDGQAEDFANRENPAGTQNGWRVRQVDPVRVRCADQPTTHVHVVFEC